MRIGTLSKTQRNRMNFKTWVKEFWQPGIVKELKIIRIFLPSKFNNFTLICLDEEKNLEVSRTLSVELGKELIKNFKLSVKIHRQGTLYLRINEVGDQDIIDKKDEQKVYIFEKNSFVLKDIKEIHDIVDDIPF